MNNSITSQLNELKLISQPVSGIFYEFISFVGDAPSNSINYEHLERGNLAFCKLVIKTQAVRCVLDNN